LQGVDGVVFVADSSAAMMQENLESLRNLEENLNEYGKSLATMPHVIQFNKRDLPDAMSCDELNAHLNVHAAPFFEAIANTGQGVFPTLKALASRVLEAIHAGSSGGGPGVSRPQPAPQQPRAPMPQPAPAPVPMQRGPQAAPAGAYANAQLQRTGFQAPQPSIPMPQQGYQGQPMQGGPQMIQPPMIAPQQMQMQQQMMQPAPIPMQPQGQQLVQTGFHQQVQPAQMQQQYAQQQPQQQQVQSAGSLQMASPRSAGVNPGAHSAPSAPVSRNVSAPSAPSTRSAAAPTPKPRPAQQQQQTALDGTRFRPRGSPGAQRHEPRATPVAKPGGRLYMAMFITAALVVGAGVTYAIVSFF